LLLTLARKPSPLTSLLLLEVGVVVLVMAEAAEQAAIEHPLEHRVVVHPQNPY
jgi:hypothetical protein